MTISREEYLKIIRLKRKWTENEIRAVHYYELDESNPKEKNPHRFKEVER